MLQAIRDFRIGRPQIFAGLLLLVFLGQSLWVATERPISSLEYEYLLAGYQPAARHQLEANSPFTAVIAALPMKVISRLRSVLPDRLGLLLAIPRRWVLRLPFAIFGVWLGAALWWVARRLFGDAGGYIALALYCFSPAMIENASNIAPDIILAWSCFGLIYTAIGVAHTVYAPPAKWLPRILILGTAIGICLSTVLWSFTFVLLAFAFMLYLTPGHRGRVLVVLGGATTIGCLIFVVTNWLAGGPGWGTRALITPRLGLPMLKGLAFAYADGYVFPAMLLAALVAYATWPRARYFGNTAPLMAAFATVLLLAMVPAIHMWELTIGLSFAFLFVAGVAADVLETPLKPVLSVTLFTVLIVRAGWGLLLLERWIHQINVR